MAARGPDQPSLATQPLTERAFQISCVDWPSSIWLAAISSVSVGAGRPSNVTARTTCPPGPRHCSLNSRKPRVAASDTWPDSARVPLHSASPLARHSSASVLTHCNVTNSPTSKRVAVSVKSRLGAGRPRSVTLSLVCNWVVAQVSEKTCSPAAISDTDSRPDKGLRPSHPPEAKHSSAWSARQLSWTCSPTAASSLLAVSSTVGATGTGGRGAATPEPASSPQPASRTSNPSRPARGCLSARAARASCVGMTAPQDRGPAWHV